MRFTIVSDSNYECKLGELSFYPRELEDWLHFKNYGSDLSDIGIVLMCRSPEYNFKQRIRMSKKDKTLNIDIMLDYYFTSDASIDDKQK
ncbi:hypothetical protein IRZ71_20330 [Flavobacterium sp. ANB]|uniref:hypothetical protein n=1 Tax=unclassified Flavobacterium TaxID=196869 RepID=UPI0012B977C6|nr:MULTISPECIES: hypothetical protein [unclassified Flavobacterium]MBF4518710.1 hypothetical protein [Flavobacterium sp. ANB]MTD67785.1 hypothetical protein [Flavobacterium sp. LC2016-13]